jgi:hypothetical protein
MAKIKAEPNLQRELEELRARVAALEQDNESLMDMRRNMAKFFALDGDYDDKLEEYKKGEFKALDVIIRHVDRGNPITSAQYNNIEKFSNIAIYSGANWLRTQLISAFGKLYYRVNKVQPQELKFDEVKSHLSDISKITDKLDVQVYIRNLKTK